MKLRKVLEYVCHDTKGIVREPQVISLTAFKCHLSQMLGEIFIFRGILKKMSNVPPRDFYNNFVIQAKRSQSLLH